MTTASSLLSFFGTQLRCQNFNLAPTQYRQLRRLGFGELGGTLHQEFPGVPPGAAPSALVNLLVKYYYCRKLNTCKFGRRKGIQQRIIDNKTKSPTKILQFASSCQSENVCLNCLFCSKPPFIKYSFCTTL